MIAKVVGSGERITHYEISDREMATGSTLGSPTATLLIKATGAVERFYSVSAGKIVFGTLVVHHWDERTEIALPSLPGTFIIHPEHQEHVFELANGLFVEEDIFVLSGPPNGDRVDPPAAYYKVTMRNGSDHDVRIGTYASLQMRGNMRHDVASSYNEDLNAFVVWNRSKPLLADRKSVV